MIAAPRSASFLLVTALGVLVAAVSAMAGPGAAEPMVFRTISEVEPNNDTASANPVLLGDTVLGTQVSGEIPDVFALTLTEGTWVRFRTTRGVIDLADWQPTSRVTGRAEYLALRIGETGKYYVAVHTVGVAGDYVLSLDAAPERWIYEAEPNDDAASAIPMALGDTIAGFIHYSGDVDHYTIDLQAGTQVTFGAFSAGSIHPWSQLRGIYMHAATTLRAPDGRTVSLSDSPLVVPMTGTYSLSVHNSAGGGAGGWHYYLLRPQLAGEPGTLFESEPNDDLASADLLPIGSTVTGIILEAGDVDYHAFDFSRGMWAEVRFAAPDTWTPRTTALGPDGAPASFAPSRFLVLESGQYALRVEDHHGAGDLGYSYALQVREWVPPAGFYSEDPGDSTVQLVPLGDTIVIGSINPPPRDGQPPDRDSYRIVASPGDAVAVHHDMRETPGTSIYGLRANVACSDGNTECVVDVYYSWPPPPYPDPWVGVPYGFYVFRYPTDPARAARHRLEGGLLTSEQWHGIDIAGNANWRLDIGDVRALHQRQGALGSAGSEAAQVKP